MQKKSDCLQQFLTYLKVSNGPTHTEIIVSKNKEIFIVETHIRLAGDMIPYLINKIYDEDIHELVVRQSIGECIETRLSHLKPINKVAAIIYSNTMTLGIINSIKGIDEVKKLSYVDEVYLHKNEGDKVHTIKSSLDRILHVRTTGINEIDAYNKALEAIDMIKVDISGEVKNERD